MDWLELSREVLGDVLHLKTGKSPSTNPFQAPNWWMDSEDDSPDWLPLDIHTEAASPRACYDKFNQFIQTTQGEEDQTIITVDLQKLTCPIM